MECLPIGIECTCDGNFIIDSTGIHSNGKVAIKKWYWEGNVIKIEGIQNTVNMTSNGIVANFISGNNINLEFYGGKIIDSIINNSTINFGGNFLSITNNDHVVLNHKWSETGKENVCIEKIITRGNTKLDINIPLHEECNVSTFQHSIVKIWRNNPNCNLIINANGSSDVSGFEKVNTIVLVTSDNCSVNGFISIKNINIKSSGISKVNLYYGPGCHITKEISGGSQVNINED